MNETVTINGINVYQQDSNGEYRLNYDAVNSKFNGFDYSKINKLYAFQSVNDPVIGPTEDTTKELAEFIFREYIGPKIRALKLGFLGDSAHNVEFLQCGHLCSIPYIPVVDQSFMSFMSHHFILDWSRNKSDESKIKEAQQITHFYDRVKYILNDHFQ